MIFLSASIPEKYGRNPKYYKSADIIAIREAVKALAMTLLPTYNLVWGGHPAISPLIKFVLETMDIDARNRVTIYQSEFFKNRYYEGNAAFGKIVETPAMANKEDSIAVMRNEMLSGHPYKAGVFIGGMEGVEQEFYLFRERNPGIPVYPVASTGGAAKVLFKEYPTEDFADILLSETGYYALFNTLFRNVEPDYLSHKE